MDRLKIGDVVESRDIAHVLRAALAAAPCQAAAEKRADTKAREHYSPRNYKHTF